MQKCVFSGECTIYHPTCTIPIYHVPSIWVNQLCSTKHLWWHIQLLWNFSFQTLGNDPSKYASNGWSVEPRQLLDSQLMIFCHYCWQIWLIESIRVAGYFQVLQGNVLPFFWRWYSLMFRCMSWRWGDEVKTCATPRCDELYWLNLRY